MEISEFKSNLNGSRVLVVGLGKSGKAAVEVLIGLRSKVSVQDSSSEDKIAPEYMEYLKSNGVTCFFGCSPEANEHFDLLVLSPGVPPTLEFIENAKANGAEVIGELELAYRLTNAKFVAITGTNGKTTTTTLVGEIFKASGRRTAVVGNIGNPVVTEAINAGSEDWLITEASSFQLETTVYFKPVVSAILNLTPDHLNRHGTMEAYGDAKARVAINQNENDYLVINYDNKEAYALAEQSSAKKIPFTRTEILETGAYLDGTSIIVKDVDGTEYFVCDTSELKIIGDHNVENVLAAAAICYFAGIDPQVISKTIKEFPGVEHRIEFSGRINGVDYYNDSKGTNVDAAVIALKALKNNIVLIAGGDGKSQDFTDLAVHLNGTTKALVLLGRDAPQIEEAARREGFTNIINCKTMEECVQKASEIANPGDKVLLSPACASWDMYANYEVRGRHFKDCVNNLNEG